MYEWEGATPKPTLTSQAAKTVLVQSVIEPVLERGLKVSAVRLCWFGDDVQQLQPFWENIMSLREELDGILKETPGVPFFVSCLTATISGKKKRLTFPGVAYWIASEKDTPVRSLFDRMQNNGLGAKMKLILQPYQESLDHVCQSMYTVAKDSVDGVVKKVFLRQTTLLQDSGSVGITKLCSQSEGDRQWLDKVAEELRDAKMNVCVDIASSR